MPSERKRTMSKLEETIALAKSQNMIDDRNALFFANAKKLPNGEFGLCLVCINGNTMGIYDTDFSQNIGEQIYKIELNGISNIKSSSFVFNRYLKFEYTGNKYYLADFGDAKRLIDVVMAESNTK